MSSTNFDVDRPGYSNVALMQRSEIKATLGNFMRIELANWSLATSKARGPVFNSQIPLSI